MPQPAPQRQTTFPLWFYFLLCGLIPVALFVQDIKTGEITGGYPFLSMAIKNRESEGRRMAGSVNGAQAAYVLQHGKFATTPQALKLNLSPEGRYYHYQMLPQSDPQLTLVTADPTLAFEGDDLKHYRGAVKQITAPAGKHETLTILCEQTRSRHSWLYGAPHPPGLPFYAPADQQLHCGEGSLDVNR